MTVWIIAIAMTAATLAALLVPLFRQRGATPDAADYDVEVYKDQLVQTNADYDAGLLTAEQHKGRTYHARGGDGGIHI